MLKETVPFFARSPDKRKTAYISIPWTFSVNGYPISRGRGVLHFRLQTCNYFHENECASTDAGPLKSAHSDEGHTFPLQNGQCESLGKEMWLGTKDFSFFPQSHFRSDITLPLSKTGLLISLIYLYYSVSRPCLWFFMQNSTQLLNLRPLCLCFIFDQILSCISLIKYSQRAELIFHEYIQLQLTLLIRKVFFDMNCVIVVSVVFIQNLLSRKCPRTSAVFDSGFYVTVSMCIWQSSLF